MPYIHTRRCLQRVFVADGDLQSGRMDPYGPVTGLQITVDFAIENTGLVDQVYDQASLYQAVAFSINYGDGEVAVNNLTLRTLVIAGIAARGVINAGQYRDGDSINLPAGVTTNVRELLSFPFGWRGSRSEASRALCAILPGDSAEVQVQRLGIPAVGTSLQNALPADCALVSLTARVDTVHEAVSVVPLRWALRQSDGDDTTNEIKPGRLVWAAHVQPAPLSGTTPAYSVEVAIDGAHVHVNMPAGILARRPGWNSTGPNWPVWGALILVEPDERVLVPELVTKLTINTDVAPDATTRVLYMSVETGATVAALGRLAQAVGDPDGATGAVAQAVPATETWPTKTATAASPVAKLDARVPMRVASVEAAVRAAERVGVSKTAVLTRWTAYNRAVRGMMGQQG